jgi:phage terminase small subunit
MGKMTRTEVMAHLREINPGRQTDKLVMYVDAYMDYQEAADNIRENGAVVAHPKTGAPFDNPYLKVRQQMLVTLQKMNLNTEGLWE